MFQIVMILVFLFWTKSINYVLVTKLCDEKLQVGTRIANYHILGMITGRTVFT